MWALKQDLGMGVRGGCLRKEAGRQREGTLWRWCADRPLEGKKGVSVVQACFIPSSGLVPSAVLIVAKKCPS